MSNIANSVIARNKVTFRQYGTFISNLIAIATENVLPNSRPGNMAEERKTGDYDLVSGAAHCFSHVLLLGRAGAGCDPRLRALPPCREPPAACAVDSGIRHLRAKTIMKERPDVSMTPAVFLEKLQMNCPRICRRIFADTGEHKQNFAYN